MSIQSDILKDIIDDPVHLATVTMPPANAWQRILQKLKIREPEVIRLELKGAFLRTQYKVSDLVLSMRFESELEGTAALFDLMKANAYQQAIVIATAIHNHNSPTPERLVNVFLDNFNNEQLKAIFQEVYRRLDMENFFGNMALLRDLAIVKDIPETIASQPLSEISNLRTN